MTHKHLRSLTIEDFFSALPPQDIMGNSAPKNRKSKGLGTEFEPGISS